MLTAKDIIILREMTGSGLMECKKAMIECNGDIGKAKKYLYDNGLTDNSIYNPEQSSDDKVKCPYCGSTQIQMVARKWSPMTGFLTNKVDRVCVRCMRKF